MVVGHFGIAELGKASRRELPLRWLVVAAYLPDLCRILLALVTSEHEVFSHAIPVVLVMGLVAGALWRLRGGSLAGAAVLALVCFLHWPADVFTGCKPTTFDGPWIGLGSYRHPVGDLLMELPLLIAGWLLLRRSRQPISHWSLIGGFALQLGFLTSLYWGSEFYIGDREWTWKPHSSLLPQPHVYEQTTCKATSADHVAALSFDTGP